MSIDNQNDESVIRLTKLMLSEAARKSASDVRIEQAEHEVSFRYNFDGVLNKFPEPQ